MNKLLVLVLLFAACARADEFNLADRVRMLDIPPASITMESTINAAAAAASDEDLPAFLDCFTPSAKQRLRNKTTALFLQHSVSMTIVETHMLYETKTKGAVAVRYNIKLSDVSYAYISRLELTRDADGWKIGTEKVLQWQIEEPPRPRCVGGQCRF